MFNSIFDLVINLHSIRLGFVRVAQPVAALQPGCEKIEREWENGERMRKLRGNGENMRKWEEMEREWGNGARDRMRERKNFISVFPSVCCKTLKNFNFCQKTLKYVTFCRGMLRYGTFCRECRKNLNIRAMRKWFWIKSGCEEAPQVVPAWLGQKVSTNKQTINKYFMAFVSRTNLYTKNAIVHTLCHEGSLFISGLPYYLKDLVGRRFLAIPHLKKSSPASTYQFI